MGESQIVECAPPSRVAWLLGWTVAVLATTSGAACHSLIDLREEEGTGYRKRLTVHGGTVPGTANLAGFPLLVDLQAPELRYVADGGGVADPDGQDLVFRADGVALPYELETYDGSVGRLRAWVRVPTLTLGIDTLIDLEYGKIGGVPPDPADVWSGYRAVWHFSESPSGNAPQVRDSTAYAHHADVQGDMPSGALVGGKIGPGLEFDGIDDRALTADPADGSLDFSTESFSYSVWVLATTSAGLWDMPLFKGGSSTTVKGYDIELGTQDWSTWVGDGVANAGCQFGQETNFLGSWTYLVTVVDRSAGRLRTYADGAFANETSIAGMGSFESDFPATIGGDEGDPVGNTLRGRIDELRIAGFPRSAEWIAAEYANQSSPSTFCSAGPAEALPATDP